jgi:KaiC/GvpD/RAD55 family RecA-like ATPase
VTFRSAAELATHPSLMEPPTLLVPPLGVAGRVALLTLGPKAGKSTTAAGMLADASRRGIRCGLLTLDEALPDSLQRLDRFGADLDLVYIDDEFATARESAGQPSSSCAEVSTRTGWCRTPAGSTA